MISQFLYSHSYTNGTCCPYKMLIYSCFVKFTIHIRTHRTNVNIKLDNLIYTHLKRLDDQQITDQICRFIFWFLELSYKKKPNTKAHIFQCFSSQSKFIQSSLNILTYYNWTQHRMKLLGLKKNISFFFLLKICLLHHPLRQAIQQIPFSLLLPLHTYFSIHSFFSEPLIFFRYLIF